MKKPIFAIAIMAAAQVYAQVEVIESRPIGTATGDAGGQSGAPVRSAAPVRAGASGGGGEMFYQLQVLQEEVLQLRGMVEEQAFEIKRLKQQRMDDYLDLDRRLSALANSGAAGATASAAPPSAPGQVGGLPADSADERQIYRKAIDLVLKQKDYDQAIGEFNNYLAGFPAGHYAANSHYWLGEIYLLKNNLEQARQWFTKLVDGFPDHSKAPDARFKLGTVYNLMGNKARARELLQEVAGSNTDAGRLARNYLKENF